MFNKKLKKEDYIECDECGVLVNKEKIEIDEIEIEEVKKWENDEIPSWWKNLPKETIYFGRYYDKYKYSIPVEHKYCLNCWDKIKKSKKNETKIKK